MFVAYTLRSLAIPNYRIWASGAFVSNVGTWIQRTAQDWLVFTELTRHDALAVGIVVGLQFGPQLLLLPWSGFAADHFDRQKLLITTQTALGVIALFLGILTVAGHVQLWHVYILTFLSGCAEAFDAPARQVFVSELVGDEALGNAVALNSTSFNSARMIGPAIAGILISLAGTGWAFLINAASFGALICSLCSLNAADLHPTARAARVRGSLVEGFSYVRQRSDLKAILVILFILGTFGLNFPLFISTMSVSVFHLDADHYGLLTSCMAIGTVVGTLIAAGLQKPHAALLLIAIVTFGFSCAFASIAPTYEFFGAALFIMGLSAFVLTNITNTFIQLSTEPVMRGRVMAIRLAVALGGAPIGAPIVGWVANYFNPRWALGVGAGAGLAAALIAAYQLITTDREPYA